MRHHRLADWFRSSSGWARKQALRRPNPIMKTGLRAAMILLTFVLVQNMVPAQVAAAPSLVLIAQSDSMVAVVGTTNVNDQNFGGVSLACPAGKVAVGGGIDPSNVLTEFVTSSGPTWGG